MSEDEERICNRNVADALVIMYGLEWRDARRIAPSVRAVIETEAYMKLDDVFKKQVLERAIQLELQEAA